MIKRIVIVVGPPRSGTSVVSHVLNKLGVDFGDPSRFVDPDLNAHNPIFFELVSLNEINNEIIAYFSKIWNNFDWTPEISDFNEQCISLFENKIFNFIEKEFSNKQIIGLKDPRFCYTLPLWDSILSRLGFSISYVLVRRLASSVFISNKLVNKQSSANNFRLVTQSSLLARHFLEGRNFLTVDYDNMLKDPGTSVRHICNDLEFDPSLIADACSVIEVSLYHQKKTSSTSPFFYFENVIDSLPSSPDEYHRYREIYTSATFEKDQQIVGFRQAVSEREQALAASSTQIATLGQSITERDRQISELNQVIAERDQALAASSNQIATLGQCITESEVQIGDLKEAVVARDEQIVKHNKVSTERGRSISSQTKQIEQYQRAIHDMSHSLSWRVTKPLRVSALPLIWIAHCWRDALKAVTLGGGLASTIGLTARVLLQEGIRGVTWRLNNSQKLSAMTINQSDAVHVSTLPDRAVQCLTPIRARSDYADWIKCYDALTDDIRAIMRTRIDGFSNKPLISVLMPTYNSNTQWLIDAIESVRQQIYPYWELCIADDASTDIEVLTLLKRYAADDARIKVVLRGKNGHISAASNSALEIATGDWIALLDHDDLLSEHALFWIADTINTHPQSRLLYSDEDKVDGHGNRSAPFFKPSWSPHLMISQAYLGHLVCYQKTLIDTVGGFNTELNGAQDYGLALACIRHIASAQVQHIPHILYHWRMHAASTAQTGNAKPYAHEAGRKAVEMYIQNNFPGLGMRAVDGDFLFTYKAEFELPADLLVSIIIPTKDGLDYLKPCIESIFNHSNWQNLEIVILDNGSEKTETIHYLKELEHSEPRVRVIPVPIPFNWSKLNNIGAKQARGSVLIFLNNDTQVITPSWIESMAGYARLPNVGTVGALLLFEDGSIQHSGVVVGMGGWADHVFRTVPAQHSGGPFVSPVLTRNVLAVTGACVAISRERLEDLGGFDESFIICGSDVELGLRAHKQGLFNVMCAEAKLFHYESKTRTPDIPPEDFIQSSKKYAPYRQEITDPYYNKNLSLNSTKPSVQGAPRAS